jgi:ABC-type tungstate transport system permease subunit
MKAYTLSDCTKHLALCKKSHLPFLGEGDPSLRNVYEEFEVNLVRFPKVKAIRTRAFADFMVSKPVRARIKVFGISLYGSQLFFLHAVVPKPDGGRS